MENKVTSSSEPIKVAVIGGGVSGLTAAWILNQYPSHFKVSLFEKRNYLGGHCKTIKVPPLKEFQANPYIENAPVDTGFILCNPKTYPNFFNLLNVLNIHLTPANTSFSLSKNGGQFEWASHHLFTFFAQTESWFNFSQQGLWRMLYDMMRFFHIANDIAYRTEEFMQLENEVQSVDSTSLSQEPTIRDSGTIATMGAADTQNDSPSSYMNLNSGRREGPNHRSRLFYEKYSKMTLKQFLKEGNYSYAFQHYFLIPQTASIWSSEPGTCMESFPLLPLIQFLKNHDMLRFFGKATWLTIPFGASSYIEKLAEDLPDLHVATGVKKVQRGTFSETFQRNQVLVVDDKKNQRYFDYVIFAIHADQVLSILTDPTMEETEAFQSVKFTLNRVVLHRDPKFMPKIRSTWASWNYSTHEDSTSTKLSLTYWMNQLQPFLSQHTHGDLFLTLNPWTEPSPSLILKEGEYMHPKFDLELHKLQHKLPNLLHTKYTGYAGAWTQFGFHEDGVTSGILAAASLGASPPFLCDLHGRSLSQWPRLTSLPLLPTPVVFLQQFQWPSIPKPQWSFFSMVYTKLNTFFFNPLPSFLPPPGPSNLGRCNVPFIPPAFYLRSFHGSHLQVYDLIEMMLFWWLVLWIGLPLFLVFWALGKVTMEDGIETSDRKEILWVHPRVRIVWKKGR